MEAMLPIDTLTESHPLSNGTAALHDSKMLVRIPTDSDRNRDATNRRQDSKDRGRSGSPYRKQNGFSQDQENSIVQLRNTNLAPAAIQVASVPLGIRRYRH